jgi:hypothetical protein
VSDRHDVGELGRASGWTECATRLWWYCRKVASRDGDGTCAGIKPLLLSETQPDADSSRPITRLQLLHRNTTTRAQDFPYPPLARWRKAEEKDRRGLAQIRQEA